MEPLRAPSLALGRTPLWNLQRSRVRRGTSFQEEQVHHAAAPVQPEAPENMLEALQGASINEEHRAIMSAVVQKVQSAKNGLTEACTSLLTGFEVSKESVNNSTA